MKKLIALIAVQLMTLTAFAGPYFVLENEGLALKPALTVGVDWETTIGDVFTGPSFGGDFSFGFENILAELDPSNEWTMALDMILDWGAVRGEFGSEIFINPERFPNQIEILTDSNVGLKVVGVLDPVEVWGGVRLEYAPITSPVVPDAWAPILFFGIEVHLD